MRHHLTSQLLLWIISILRENSVLMDKIQIPRIPKIWFHISGLHLKSLNRHFQPLNKSNCLIWLKGSIIISLYNSHRLCRAHDINIPLLLWHIREATLLPSWKLNIRRQENDFKHLGTSNSLMRLKSPIWIALYNITIRQLSNCARIGTLLTIRKLRKSQWKSKTKD